MLFREDFSNAVAVTGCITEQLFHPTQLGILSSISQHTLSYSVYAEIQNASVDKYRKKFI